MDGAGAARPPGRRAAPVGRVRGTTALAHSRVSPGDGWKRAALGASDGRASPFAAPSGDPAVGAARPLAPAWLLRWKRGLLRLPRGCRVPSG